MINSADSVTHAIVFMFQGATRPCKGKDAVYNGLTASVRRSSGPATSSCGSRSIAIPSNNRYRPIVPCHGSVEGFNQVVQRDCYFAIEDILYFRSYPLFSACWCAVKSSLTRCFPKQIYQFGLFSLIISISVLLPLSFGKKSNF